MLVGENVHWLFSVKSHQRSQPPGIFAVVDFYKQLGFEADPEGIRGMFW